MPPCVVLPTSLPGRRAAAGRDDALSAAPDRDSQGLPGTFASSLRRMTRTLEEADLRLFSGRVSGFASSVQVICQRFVSSPWKE